jgi:selenocysteine lyase/cysteine desulfurase
MNDIKIGSRLLFPNLEPLVYLNHAAVSPPSTPVIEASKVVIDDYARKGINAVGTWIEQRERLRKKLAELINSSPSEIGFCANTTGGIVHVAHSVRWRKGDKVLLFKGEFPTNVTPWQQAMERCNGEVMFMDATMFHSDPEAAIKKLSELLSKDIRLLACSAVQFQTGFYMPLEEIGSLCAASGTLFAVDAIQACGVLQIDTKKMNVDFLSCGSHKWLMGLEGCGFIFINQDQFSKITPQTAGWLSHEGGPTFLYHPDKLSYDRPIKKNASFIEHGAMNAIGFAALEASLDVIVTIGRAKIYNHIQKYHNHLESIMNNAGFESHRPVPGRRSGILSFKHPKIEINERILNLFLKKGVSCSVPDGYLRFSPHWPNSTDELDHVAEIIQNIVDEATQAQA